MSITDSHTFPKVSIIISTYNGEKYIGETIESVRAQTYQNWELIIIDDGSEDKTGEIVKGIRDERINFIKAGRIGKNGLIKNIGLQRASGELIAFLDHDDLWAATKLEKQVMALHQYPEAGFSLTGGYNFREPGKPIEYFYKQIDGIRCDNVFLSFFQSEVAGFAQALMLRKRCIEVAGAFDETKPFSDAAFIIGLASHFKAVILYEPLVFRRLHKDNESSANWEKGYHQGIAMIRDYKNTLPNGIARDALFRLYINFGEGYLSRRKRGMAFAHFLKAWQTRPLSNIPLKKTAKTLLDYFKT